MRRGVSRVLVAAWCVAIWAGASAARGEPELRGPPFGSNTYATEIRTLRGVDDVDDYVTALMAGERLEVQVAAGAGSALRPSVAVVAPGGSELPVPMVPARGGRAVRLAPLVVPETGPWVVRVRGDSGTQGAYSVRFRVRPPSSVRLRDQRVGDVGAVGTATASHRVQAVEGSLLSVSLVGSRRAAVDLVAIEDPQGDEVPRSVSDVQFHGTHTRLTDLPLTSGHGAYTVRVAAETPARYSIRLRVRPPPRPRGRIVLDAGEPYLDPSPVEGWEGRSVRIEGARFARTQPGPRVWFGEAEGAVLGVADAGLVLLAAPPPAPEGTVVSVTVVNPDGQATTRADHFRYVPPEPLVVSRINPTVVTLSEGAAQTFTVTLSRRAPAPGVTVTLAVTGGAGSAPDLVTVPPGALAASFVFTAASSAAAGRVVATLGATVESTVTVGTSLVSVASIEPTSATLAVGAARRFMVRLTAPGPSGGVDVALAATDNVGALPAALRIAEGRLDGEFEFVASSAAASGRVTATLGSSVEASVEVVAPAPRDVSGWALVQTNSLRTFTLPEGTWVAPGGYLVVARKASLGAFEGFWGRGLGADVVYIDSGDTFPSINGQETFELRNAAGTSVDGPTIQLATGMNYQRQPGTDAGQASSWSTGTATSAVATPGSGQPPEGEGLGVYISEFSDAQGSGNWIYEFVEIHFDGAQP